MLCMCACVCVCVRARVISDQVCDSMFWSAQQCTCLQIYCKHLPDAYLNGFQLDMHNVHSVCICHLFNTSVRILIFFF